METKYKVREITPEANMCIAAACPAIYEITPKDMKCMIGGCPAIYEKQEKCIAAACPTIEGHEGKYLIVGQIEDAKEFGLEKKVGEGEILISVPKELINDMKK